MLVQFFCASLAAARIVAGFAADDAKEEALDAFRDLPCVAVQEPVENLAVVGHADGEKRDMLILQGEVGGRTIYTWTPVDSPVGRRLAGVRV